MESAAPKEKTKIDKKLFIIFMIIFTEVLGFSIVIPVLPFLVLSFGLNAFEVGLITSVFSICQLIASPVFGKLSDKYGRKPILIISQISTFLGFLLLGLADSILIIILARMIDGLLGSNHTVSQAYISDITTHEEKTKIFGYSSAVFGAGLIFGPLLGGLLSTISYSAPMFLAAGISIISVILVIFYLPESLENKQTKVEFRFEDIFPIKEAKKFFKVKHVRDRILLFFLYSLGFMMFISSFPLFAQAQIGITSVEVGFYMMWIGILRVIFQTFLVKKMLQKSGEDHTLSIGIISMIISMIVIAITGNFWVGFLSLFFLAIGTGLCRPIMMSKLTKCVPRNETGSILGVTNSLNSISQIITPILGGAIIAYYPSFLLPTISAFLFLFMMVYWGKMAKKDDNLERSGNMEKTNMESGEESEI
jgi:MFS transporter, DHA1 family, tetracycline resistance protein